MTNIADSVRALLRYLVDRVAEELPEVRDDAEALRRALLTCVLLLEPETNDVHRCFQEFLLTEFKPLTEQMKQHKHVLFRNIEVRVARTNDGDAQLFLPIDRMKKLIENLGEEN